MLSSFSTKARGILILLPIRLQGISPRTHMRRISPALICPRPATCAPGGIVGGSFTSPPPLGRRRVPILPALAELGLDQPLGLVQRRHSRPLPREGSLHRLGRLHAGVAR